ncbi:MAG: methyltransferase domain-containing protein, partial [Deltaproteobacteria bacterium]|nr:methyltransferase domain-containing protein [Deltaproteobacteria bacterium]
MLPSPESLLPPGYRVSRTTVAVEQLTLDFFRVANPNELSDSLDAESFGEDERFPYWAELWPSSLALARLLARRGLPPGSEALELGCGMGLVGVTAAVLGARVTFTDFEADALAFAAANHALNLGALGSTMQVDWRAPPEGLTAPLVLASDVLYERRFLEPFLATLRRVLGPGGTALVAEPGRRIAEGTVERLEAEGFGRDLHLE